MLRQLLALLETGGIWNIADLASALDTPPDLVNAMLSHLAQSGKLDISEQPCAGACAGCSVASACKTGSINHAFVYVSPASRSAETVMGDE
jgi:hypothetical protein